MRYNVCFLISLVFVFCLISFFCSKLSYAESNELKNYYCPKCGTHIESITEPRGGNCPEGGAHHWRCLGPVGEKLFQCDKCGLIVKSKDYPYGGVNCKKVGGHIWKRIS